MLGTELPAFSWNLGKKATAAALARQHLETLAKAGPFVACLQEVPAKSDLAKMRVPLKRPRKNVVPPTFAVVPTRPLVRGLVIAHHPSMGVLDATSDPDNEYISALFSFTGSLAELRVVCVHGESQIGLRHAADRGGARALLRNALASLKSPAVHCVIIGDFNSEFRSREIKSFHGFYALSGSAKPLAGKNRGHRRNVPHPPLRAIGPADHSGTFRFADSGEDDLVCIDFMVVSESIAQNAQLSILKQVAGSPVYDPKTDAPIVGDHLPIQGRITIP